LKAIKGLDQNELEKQLYTVLIRHLIKLGEDSSTLKKLFEEIQMRFYYQQGKTLIDQDLILAKGEYLML